MTRIRSFISVSTLLLILAALPWVARADSRAVVFSFSSDSLKGGSRGPASMMRFKGPELIKLERPDFLPPRDVVHFDGASGFVHPAPVATTGTDGRGTFTAEAVIYPLRLNGKRILFSNVQGRSGLSFAIVDGRLEATVYLRANGAKAPTRYMVTGLGPRTHVWQQVVLIGSERGADFEVRLLIDGREAGRGRCLACGRIEQSPASFIVGASPSGADFFKGYLQSIALRNYGIPAHLLRGTSVAVSDGAESWWAKESNAAIGALEGVDGVQEKIAVPFTSDGYRLVGFADTPAKDSMVILLRNDRDKASPPLIVSMGADRKIKTVFGLFGSDGKSPLRDVSAFAVSGDALLVIAGHRLLRLPMHEADPSVRLSHSDWLDRYIAYLQSDWPGGRMPDWEDLTPGGPPLRRWDYVRIRADLEIPLDGESRFASLSSGDRGEPRVWTLSRHSSGAPELRAYALDEGAKMLRKTSTHYLLPGSFSRELSVSVTRDTGKDVIYSTHREKEGDFEVHRLEPWAEHDVRSVFRSANRIGQFRYEAAERRLWIAPAGGAQPFLFSLKTE